MTEPQKHDWQQIIFELKRMYRETEGRDLSDYKLGLMIGMSDKSVAILAKRGEPRHRPGQLLIEWHSELFRKTAASTSASQTQ